MSSMRGDGSGKLPATQGLARGAWLAPMTAFTAAYVIAHLFYPAANIRFVLRICWEVMS